MDTDQKRMTFMISVLYLIFGAIIYFIEGLFATVFIIGLTSLVILFALGLVILAERIFP